MSLRWEDERYVRLYTRDTVAWKVLPWQSKALLPLLLRKLDRAGVLDLGGEEPAEAVAVATDLPKEVVEVGLRSLQKRDTIRITKTALVMPNFIAAQEAPQSDRQRKTEQRARARDIAAAEALNLITQEPQREEVTKRDEMSRAVTSSHVESLLAVPSRAVPSRAEPPLDGRAEPAPTDPPPTPPTKTVVALGEAASEVFKAERGHAYEWTRADEDALRHVLKHGDAEVLRRWRIGLRTDYPRCDAVRHLALNWNSYATDQPRKAKDFTKGHVRAETQKHSDVVGDITDEF